MKKIVLKSLQLSYFKGIKKITIPFNSDVTEISGANETGKTTIFDAFNFLLFGKNSEDRKDFNIKMLDENNQPLQKVDCEVLGVIEIDGIDFFLKRIYKEKWTKKRGEEQAEFSGNETLYFVNQVPYSQADYQKYIDSIIPEARFKLLTNPYYFNSLKWDDRRKALFGLIPSISNSEIAKGNEAFEKLIAQGKDLELLKKELAAKRKLLKESIEHIPARIDELNKTILEIIDEEKIKKDINQLEERIKRIDENILSEANKIQEANKIYTKNLLDINKLESNLQSLIFEEKEQLNKYYNVQLSELSSFNAKIENDKYSLHLLEQNIKANESNHKNLIKQKENLLEQWNKKNTETLIFNPADEICPTCKRAYENTDVEAKQTEMLQNYNINKQENLTFIEQQGKTIKESILSLEQVIQGQEGKKKALENSILLNTEKFNKLNNIQKPEYKESKTVINLRKEIELKRKDLIEVKPVDNLQLLTEKAGIRQEIDELNKQLTINEVNSKTQKRITELKDGEKTLAQQIANIEKDEFIIAEFTKTKIELIETKINEKFLFTKFKMYRQLVNGGEEPCCETLCNGVPFIDANHAKQINTGIDIINTFSNQYEITAPIFVDNCEAVNEVIKTESQLIKLLVTTEKTLTIK